MSDKFIRVWEVGPRDGLQNEKTPLTTADKQQMLDGLVAAGIKSVELTSFVKPEAVPQMADGDAMMRYATDCYPDLAAMGLIFNEQGYERAIAAGAKSVALVLIVTDGLSNANTGKLPEDWLKRYQTLIPRIRSNGTWLRVYLAGAWVCPFDGQTPPERVFRFADAIWELGADELCPTDVIGHAHPVQVGNLMEQLGERYDMAKLAVHLHDTQALGLTNAYAAIQAGVRTIDTSVGGLGGCPFAPGSAGNLATEDLVFMAHKMGFETGIDLDGVRGVAEMMMRKVGRMLGGRTGKFQPSSLNPGVRTPQEIASGHIKLGTQ